MSSEAVGVKGKCIALTTNDVIIIVEIKGVEMVRKYDEETDQIQVFVFGGDSGMIEKEQ